MNESVADELEVFKILGVHLRSQLLQPKVESPASFLVRILVEGPNLNLRLSGRIVQVVVLGPANDILESTLGDPKQFRLF